VYTEVAVHCYYHQLKEEVVHDISGTTSADTYIERVVVVELQAE
jgi:hypothetical protein